MTVKAGLSAEDAPSKNKNKNKKRAREKEREDEKRVGKLLFAVITVTSTVGSCPLQSLL